MPFGGTHMYYSDTPDLDRPRGIKDAATAAANWTNRTTQSGQAWVDGLQRSTKPIVARAVSQAQVAKTNFSASIDSGRWARALEAVGDAGIKSAAVAKQGNYATGVAAGTPKFQTFMTKLIQYEAAGLPAIYGMPSGSTEAGVARASAWIRYMAAGKGSFKG